MNGLYISKGITTRSTNAATQSGTHVPAQHIRISIKVYCTVSKTKLENTARDLPGPLQHIKRGR